MMMAKGSKAWFEIYENAINAFEKDEQHLCTQDADVKTIKSFDPRCLKDYEKPITDNKPETGMAGAYSSSKINWAIGRLALRIWQVLMYVHFVFLGIIIGLQCPCRTFLCVFLALIFVLIAYILNGKIIKKLFDCENLKSESIAEMTKEK